MKATVISLLLFTLFVIAHSQGDGEVDVHGENDPAPAEEAATQPPATQAPEMQTKPPSKKPRRTTTPLPLAKTEAPEPAREECSERVDIVIPLFSTCTNCTSNADCNSNYVCCPVTNMLSARDRTCCVIKRPPKPSTAAP